MSRIFEALQRSSVDLRPSHTSGPEANSKVPAVIAQGEQGLHLPEATSFTIPAIVDRRLVAVTDPLSLGAEKIRMLSARLKYLQHRRKSKKLLITSTIRGEGKTTISANLGVSLAQQHQKVLLIDGDFHQPALSEVFGIASRPGLSEWWRQQREISTFLGRAEGLPLWCLTAGNSNGLPLAMLQSPELAQLITTISPWFDWVIIDSPPLAPLADANAWAAIADSILIICRYGLTPKKVLQESIGSLEKEKIIGAVLNETDSGEHRYYADYYKGNRHRNARSNPMNGKPTGTPKQTV